MIILPAKVNSGFAIAPDQITVLRAKQQTLVCQGIQIDQIMVARICRAGLIGGIPIAGGSQGQDLPVTLASPLQKVYKFKCAFSHGADATAARQGSNMHQNAAVAHSHAPFIDRDCSRYRILADG